MRPHDLVALDPDAIRSIEDPEIRAELERVPWAVVRRLCCEREFVAIGVRGPTRPQRWPLVVPRAAIGTCIAPEALASIVATRDLPAFAALASVRLAAASLGMRWGPAGSVGFELATGAPVVHAQSDCDIVVRGASLAYDAFAGFARALAGSAVRVDVQIEFGDCGIALDEYLSSGERVMAKTPNGPQLLARAELDVA